jgi:two-component system, NtrC family, nitrogen regulation sensor histidine kinase NtrY
MIRNFRLAIFLRVFIIVVLSVGIAYIMVVKPMFFVLAAAILLLVGVIINLIVYIEKTNRDLTHFLLSIRQGAFTESYTSGNRGAKHQQLSDALNEVVNEFAKVNQEKELHYQFLQTLNENINVAILSFDEGGDVIMMNAAAKRLLQMPSFSKLEHFKKIDTALYESVNSLQPEVRTVVKVILKEEILHLGIQMKEIVIAGKPVRIVLLQNLSNELETKEIDAWQQLIRVLTHEIMNSVTPIVSLTAAVENILKTKDGLQKDFSSLTSENIEDVFSSLETIQSRSSGLLKFVTSYKEFARPIDATFEQFDAAEIVERISTLFQPQMTAVKINLALEITGRPINTNGDRSLLEQVLINLLKNAIEATPHDGTGVIRVVLRQKNRQTTIVVSDNGPGIDDETLPRIFIPFFTTKQKGSGIGLSLSRQIMKLHSGSLKVQTSGEGSVFVMEW